MKCKQCGREHKRRKFCSNKCKDRYHNLHNPRGIYAHLAEESGDERDLDDGEGQGWDAHKGGY